MTAIKDETSATLQKLITACVESSKRLRAAAEAIPDLRLKRLLLLYSQQRLRFAEELKEESRVVGAPEAAAIAHDSECASYEGLGTDQILWICSEEAGEMIELYSDALDAQIPKRSHFAIAAQFALMEQACDRLKSMTGQQTRRERAAERSYL